METGSNKSLYTLIAVVVFGIFLSLSYFLYQDQLKVILASVMDNTSQMTSTKLDNKGLIPTESKYFTTVVNPDNTIKLITYDTQGGTDLVIPAYIDGKAVTTIGSVAFQGKGLTSVVIPETVTKIEDGVGSYNSITNVDSRIGAFSDNNLTYLTIPDSVTYIGKWAFAKNKIGSLLLGSSVETIGIYSFYNNRIHVLDLPDSMRVLSHGSFEYNPIDTINFNDGLTKIYSWSFGSGTGTLSEVNVPSTVTTFDTSAFIFNESIKDFNLPQSLASKVDITKMQYTYTRDPITEITTYTYFNSSYFNFY